MLSSIMRTWVKIITGDDEKAINALRQIAVDNPQVCMYDKILEYDIPDFSIITGQWTMDYFSQLESLTLENCEDLISKSGTSTGEYDFYYEWMEEPDKQQLDALREKIDQALNELDVDYEITNK